MCPEIHKNLDLDDLFFFFFLNNLAQRPCNVLKTNKLHPKANLDLDDYVLMSYGTVECL